MGIFGTMIYFGFTYKSDKYLIDTAPTILIVVGFILLILTLIDFIVLIDFIKKSINLRLTIDKKNKLFTINSNYQIAKYTIDQILKIENHDSPNTNTISSYIRFMKITTSDNKTHKISSLIMDLNDLVHLLNIDNKLIGSKRRNVFQIMPIN